MEFHKYHALGNDYLVYDPERLPFDLDAQRIERVCHRNFGLGSDGILLGPLPSNQARFRLRIFNPDASEAEKSGNGIRIFCRFLFDTGRVSEGESFTLETLGGLVSAEVHDKGQRIKVSMGRAEFKAGRIPVKTADPESEVIRMPIEVDDNTWEFCAVSVGNPHCVIPLDTISAELAKRIGSSVEHHPMFPNRINMQLLKVIDRSNIQIEIWERGAGYTLASGTSSCACAVIARKLGLCDRDITVHMPGGTLSIQVEDDYSLTMTGPTTRVGHYVLHPECLKA
ncbi:MAG TPA: diaminopimelate epimerase [Opitutales bacterium]|nr:diaminopimelate epimerase [Opitutales bacterium]